MADRATLIAAAWLLTYLVHSTLLLGAVAFLTRRRERLAEHAWRVALFGAIATTTAQLATSGSRVSGMPSYGRAPLATLPSSLSILLIALAMVAAVRLVGLLRARRGLARELAGRRPLANASMVARAHALGGEHVRLSTSTRIRTPMIVGARELCLPARATTELSPAELDAVLAHEIAHIRRRDGAWLLLASIVERVLFVQPLNRLGVHRLRALAECSCDDWALGRTKSPIALASALARVAGWLAGAPVAAVAVGMASRESLALARVRRILDPSVRRLGASSRPRDIAVGALALIAVVLVVPGFTPQTIRYTIRAEDDAGPFTLTLERGAVIGMTIDGAAVESARLKRDGNRLRVLDARERVALDLTLTTGGGIRWTSRPPRQAIAH